MMAWLLSIPTDKLEEEYESLKNQLTQHYREELQFIFAHQRMSQTMRASFYGAEKELVMKLILLAGGSEVTQVMTECWAIARKEYPTLKNVFPSYLLPVQQEQGI